MDSEKKVCVADANNLEIVTIYTCIVSQPYLESYASPTLESGVDIPEIISRCVRHHVDVSRSRLLNTVQIRR